MLDIPTEFTDHDSSATPLQQQLRGLAASEPSGPAGDVGAGGAANRTCRAAVADRVRAQTGSGQDPVAESVMSDAMANAQAARGRVVTSGTTHPRAIGALHRRRAACPLSRCLRVFAAAWISQ